MGLRCRWIVGVRRTFVGHSLDFPWILIGCSLDLGGMFVAFPVDLRFGGIFVGSSFGSHRIFDFRSLLVGVLISLGFRWVFDSLDFACFIGPSLVFVGLLISFGCRWSCDVCWVFVGFLISRGFRWIRFSSGSRSILDARQVLIGF